MTATQPTFSSSFLPPAGAATPRIMVVGLDGLRWDLASVAAPTLQNLAVEGDHRTMMMPVPTLSGPGWSTLLTGTTYEQHRVLDNTFVGNRLLHTPDLLAQAYYQDMQTRTFAAAGWPPLIAPDGIGPVIHQRLEQQKAGLHKVIVRDGEVHGFIGVDAEITDFALDVLRPQHGAPEVAFTYFCDVDDAGHIYGAVGDEYQQAIARVDAHVGRICSALKRRTEDFGEEWLLVVIADHGHVDEGGHGGDSLEERRSFIVRWSTTGQLSNWPDQVAPHELTPLLLAERMRGRQTV